MQAEDLCSEEKGTEATKKTSDSKCSRDPKRQLKMYSSS